MTVAKRKSSTDDKPHSLVTIANPHNVLPDEWSRITKIVRCVIVKWLGGNALHGRSLMVKATTVNAADIGS
jgi:hypothetical protein